MHQMEVDRHIKRILTAFFFCITLLFSDFALANEPTTPIKDNLRTKINRPEDQILIVDLLLDDEEIIDGIIIYKDGDKILIPLSVLFKYLEIPIKIDTSSATARGWFGSEKRIFNLDLNQSQLSYNEKLFTLDKEVVELHDDDIYVEQNTLGSWLPLKIKVDQLESALKITTTEPLPMQIRKAKSARRKEMVKDEETIKKDVIMDKSLFSIPFIDLATNYRSTEYKNGDPKSKDHTYSLYGQNVFLGFDSEWSIFDSFDEFKPYTNLKFSKYYPYQQPNKLTKQVEFGDIFSVGTTLVSPITNGRGVKISSFDKDNNYSTSNVVIEGPLLDGWEVEIYQDSTLIDFREKSDHGRYQFNITNANLGSNLYRLVFYGPQGQIREEVKTVFVQNNRVKKGEIGMETSLMEDDKKFINSRNEDTPEYRTNLTSLVHYGFTDNLAGFLGGSLSKENRDPNNTNNIYSDVKGDDFAILGLNTSFLGMALQYSNAFSKKEEKFAHNFELETKLLNTNVKARYDLFGEIKTTSSLLYGQHVKDHTLIDINRNINAKFLGNIPIYLTYEKANLGAVKGEIGDIERYSWSASKNIRSAYFTLRGDYMSDYVENESSRNTLLINLPYEKFMLRSDINYQTMPISQLESIGNAIDYRAGTAYYSISWDRSYSYENYKKTKHTNNYEARAGKGTKSGNFGLAYNTDLKKFRSIELNYSVGIGYDSNSKDFQIEANGYRNNGSISVFVFIDSNHNGIFDKDEKPVQGLGFKNQSPNLKTDKRGHLFIGNIQPYISNILEIKDLEENEEINIAFPKDKIYYMVKPGSTLTLYMPAVEVGDIDGNLITSDKKPIHNIEMFLKDLDGKIVAKTTSEYDGYFLFHEIPLGKYFLSFNKDQLEKNNYRKFGERMIELKAGSIALSLTNINLSKSADSIKLKLTPPKPQNKKNKKFNIKDLKTSSEQKTEKEKNHESEIEENKIQPSQLSIENNTTLSDLKKTISNAKEQEIELKKSEENSLNLTKLSDPKPITEIKDIKTPDSITVQNNDSMSKLESESKDINIETVTENKKTSLVKSKKFNTKNVKVSNQ